MTFNMIAFSFGFMSQRAEAAQEKPALRATMVPGKSAGVLAEPSVEGRKLYVWHKDGFRHQKQQYEQWTRSESWCYETLANGTDFPTDGEEVLGGESVYKGDCERECRKRDATACRWEKDWEFPYNKGYCYAYSHPKMRDCNSALITHVDELVGTEDWCLDWDDDTRSYCMVFSRPPTTGRDMFVGCFTDNQGGQRDLPTRVTLGGRQMSYSQCTAECKRQGYAYAGRQWTNECFCGNSYNSQGPSHDCQCDDGNNVGGSVNCVYRTGPKTSASTNGIVKGIRYEFKFIGCFKDNTNHVRDLPKDRRTKLTPEKCAKACQQDGFKFMGRQWKNQCFCGDSYGSQGELTGDANTCQCDNIQNQGGNSNCVYELRY